MPRTTSEVVRSALRLLGQKEAKLAALKQAITAGEESGKSPLTLREIAANKNKPSL